MHNVLPEDFCGYNDLDYNDQRTLISSNTYFAEKLQVYMYKLFVVLSLKKIFNFDLDFYKMLSCH